MPCFRGEDFPTLPASLAVLPAAQLQMVIPTLPPAQQQQLAAMSATRQVLVSQNLWYCTSNTLAGGGECGGECIAVLVLTGLTLLLALWDMYHVQTCMRGLVAVRRHLVVMFFASGMFALLNGMSVLFPADNLMWDGMSDFIRIFFVYHYTLYLLSVIFIDGYGDYEELIEKAGVLIASQTGKSEMWVASCLFKVRVWMLEVVLSYMAKTVYDSHLLYMAYDQATQRLLLWDGALMYIAFVDIFFTLVCGLGVSQLANVLRPLLHPKMKTLVAARHYLFLFFYLIIALIYPSVVTLIFAAHVNVSDEQYMWWQLHKPTFTAVSMLFFQYGMHKLFVPPYQWGFGRASLLEMRGQLQTRADVPAFLEALAARGIVLSTANSTTTAASVNLGLEKPRGNYTTESYDPNAITLNDVSRAMANALSNETLDRKEAKAASVPEGKDDVYRAQFKALADAENSASAASFKARTYAGSSAA